MEQRSPDWFAARLGRITSTRAKAVLSKRKDSKITLIGELVRELATANNKDVPQTFWMRYGTETEPKAIAAYQVLTGALVAPGGFHIHPLFDVVADSPDGMIGLKEGVLEIKCPAPDTHGKYLAADIVPTEYESQVDWHLFVTGRSWCDFGSYCPDFPPDLQFFRKRVFAEDRDMQSIHDRVEEFIGMYESVLDRLDLRIP